MPVHKTRPKNFLNFNLINVIGKHFDIDHLVNYFNCIIRS